MYKLFYIAKTFRVMAKSCWIVFVSRDANQKVTGSERRDWRWR